ncbi:hypothetical protein D3H55_22835 [Bacillus salacetis]|uniref:Uncharacterized protein n=1 Tax=Bacillus salacetis TaxID=2315464 RepID=A0A3A1QR07_9BACI|nr:hypothetical protein [Bacillus salacetis]RIW27628.1 hypothetical protein D3H55_22835 [Bacillus salacetis]
MEKSWFELNDVDRKGNDIKIKCEGIDDKELAHFGGLDLHVKAVKTLISNANGTSFPEKEGDYSIGDKVVALYLNEIGELIRNLSSERDYLDGYTNMELVENFMEHWKENQEVLSVVQRDDALIKQDNERVREEEDAIWDDIMSGLKK